MLDTATAAFVVLKHTLDVSPWMRRKLTQPPMAGRPTLEALRMLRAARMGACRELVGLNVPRLRALFLEVFGHHTASNNGAWLRRKLSEPPDSLLGRGRSATIRKRDAGAAIWNNEGVNQKAPPQLLAPGCMQCLCMQSEEYCFGWVLPDTCTGCEPP